MALQIEVKKRFINSMQKVNKYLKREWGISVADEFTRITDEKIKLLSFHPDLGTSTAIKNRKSILVGKGYQNRLYYRIKRNKIIVIDLKDVRKNPAKNRFHQS